MSSIQPGSKVLVTGGNGYVGAWVVHALLAQGFLVRAVVRSEDKAKTLREHFTTYDHDDRVKDAAAKGALEFVYVPDFVKEGAFDDVIEGVEGVLHVASPIAAQDGTADDYILPALNGTLNLLKAASLPTSTVKRFIYTSSTATVFRPVEPPLPSSPQFSTFETIVYDENDWSVSVETLREFQAKGEEAPFMVKYSASKTLAERAAWDWVEDHKDTIGWDLVVLIPPYVLGRPLIRSQPLVTSVDGWTRIVIKGELNDKPEALDYRNPFSYVDVRDFLEAQINSLVKEEARGQRIIIAAGALAWQQAIDRLNAISSSLAPLKTPITKGVQGLTLEPLASSYNNEKSRRVLGLEYRAYEESARDMVADLSARGY